MREKPIAWNVCVLRDGIRIAVAPRLEDRRERRARHAQRIDHDVVDRDVRKPESSQKAVRFATDAQISAERLTEAARHHRPEIVGVELPGLEVNHQIVFWNQVTPPAAPGHAHELGNCAISVRNRLEDVPAYHKVKAGIRKPKLEDASVFETHA